VDGGRLLARIIRVENWPTVVPPPPDFQPRVPLGFKVSVFATGFVEPRWLTVASNGDVFVAARELATLGPHPSIKRYNPFL